MSDRMRPVPLENLLDRIIGELRAQGSIFGIKQEQFYQDKRSKKIKVFNQEASTPLGPAAGPHTQLSQNIITSYLTGARFIELKTVQILDSLEVEKPCIDARDEGYNVEWSTEFTLPKAFDEYLKAWFILHLIEALNEGKAVEPSFIFNMSVGYNLEGIKSEKMQKFISSMTDASGDKKFNEYKEIIKNKFSKGYLDGTRWEGKEEIAIAELDKISACISPSVTLSTMHGCPPQEIEAICSYMLKEKGFDTFVKLNPTLLGYDKVREVLDNLGYTYLHLKRESFEHDLQYPDAVSMLHRLVDLSKEVGHGFGVKLTNTLGSVNDQNVLPGEEMYMSGRALLPISTNVALLLSKEFDGKLPISYSGGANANTVKDLFESGIHPITVATDMLKPGGYTRLTQMVNICNASDGYDKERIDIERLSTLVEKAQRPSSFVDKEARGYERAKVESKLPLTDCFVAPCVEACPIHQDIPEYVGLMGEGREAEALAVILSKNPLVNMTGWICDHQCQNHCSRLDYEGPVEIRALKKLASEKGYERYMENYFEIEEPSAVKAAVVGAGPAGLSAAYFLNKAGFDVTLFEKEKSAGGVVKNVIPNFRIPEEVVQKDVDFIKQTGVTMKFGVKTEQVSLNALKAKGYDYIFYAIGAEKGNGLRLSGEGKVLDAISYLKSVKRAEAVNLGKNVVVVGGGNTAMDTARAAARGGAKVTVVYRRDILSMPADKEEYRLARKDGVEFCFLSNPIGFEGESIRVRKMTLGEMDASSRRRPVETEETFLLPCSAVITATGEKADEKVLLALGLPEAEKSGHVYMVGDVLSGPSTVVRCIASARKAVDECIDFVLDNMEDEEDEPECECGHHHHGDGEECHCHDEQEAEEEYSPEELREAEDLFFASIREKKAVIRGSEVGEDFAKNEAKRCLECSYLCTKCVEVCPNRANVPLDMRDCELFEDPFQILHLDAYCNECGNCATFCPHIGGPYLKKFTLFSRADDFESSKNSGFFVDGKKVRIRLEGRLIDGVINEKEELEADIPEEIMAIISEVFISYPYLLNSVEE